MFPKRLSARFLLAVVLALACVAAVAWYAWFQARSYRNLRTVKAGLLYRSGQLTKKGLERTLHELNIRTLVNLRGRDSDARANTSSWEAELCEKNFVTFVPIALGSPEQPELISPDEAARIIDQAAKQFLEILDDPERYPRPILVHCLAGVHRTGVMCALYRMEHEGWSKERALCEMKELGYRNFRDYDPLRDYAVGWVPARTTQSGGTSPTIEGAARAP
jgi:protein tyrosine/serine phosphatase